MKILGIDPGLATTGWGLIDYHKNKTVSLDYGIIATSPKKALSSRLETIYLDIQEIIDKFKPECMAVEKLFFNTNAKTALLVGQARGAVMLAGSLNKLKISEFTPLQIKLNIVGYGQAEKIQVQKMVKTLLNLETIPKPDDAADALAVAIACAYNLKEKRY